MTRFIRLLAVALGLGAALPAPAAFHLWTMNELYSNADGTIQFLELTALTGGQQFMSGHTLVSTGAGGAGTRTFTFPGNLPGDTSGRRMLIATQGFAALGAVTPDYVVPNGFFFPGGGSIDFAGSSDLWNHGPLPADNRSLDRNGALGAPTPTNFAGQTGTITLPPPAALNFQGLWWAGEAESGWGLNIAHQGDILFMTWFTYDLDGTSMWLVASEVRKTAGNTYTGVLQRTRGANFASDPFNGGAVVRENVGSVTFTFTDANNGRFDYAVNTTAGTVQQFKNITRLIFDPARVPVCVSGGSGTPNLQDLWISPDPAQAGWGLNLTHQGDILFATWFTYGAGTRGQWYVMSRLERQPDGRYTGGIQRTTGPAFNAQPFNPNIVDRIDVGTATLDFNVSPARFTYTVDNLTQTRTIQRFSFDPTPTICR